MKSILTDPIISVIYGEIKRGIRVAIENECFASAVILIFSGIDTVAWLGMPEDQQNVTKNYFIKWVDGYIKFPCDEQLTGLDLYGARCAMLHSHGVASDLSRKGHCRMVGYVARSVPEVRYNPEVDKSLVLVSVLALAEAFYNGVDQFLVDLFANKKRAEVAEKRLAEFVKKQPIKKE
jgi:hypothetical protein